MSPHQNWSIKKCKQNIYILGYLYIFNLCTNNSRSIKNALPGSAKIFQLLILKKNTEAIQKKERGFLLENGQFEINKKKKKTKKGN